MTTAWKIKPEWRGKTVAVLASGPSMSAAVAESLRKHKTIAVNHAHTLAPWADMLVVMDLNLGIWRAASNFAGIKVSGIRHDDLDALYTGSMFERVNIGPGHTVELKNSGLAAIRIAAAMGASKIILAGFDPDDEGYFAGHPVEKRVRNPAVSIALKNIIAELTSSGIVVERHSGITKELQVKRGRGKRSRGAQCLV